MKSARTGRGRCTPTLLFRDSILTCMPPRLQSWPRDATLSVPSSPPHQRPPSSTPMRLSPVSSDMPSEKIQTRRDVRQIVCCCTIHLQTEAIRWPERALADRRPVDECIRNPFAITHYAYTHRYSGVTRHGTCERCSYRPR